MIREERDQLRRDISEAFAFVRYLIRTPRALRRVRNGSEIRIVPADQARLARRKRWPKNVQAFSAETTFRSL